MYWLSKMSHYIYIYIYIYIHIYIYIKKIIAALDLFIIMSIILSRFYKEVSPYMTISTQCENAEDNIRSVTLLLKHCDKQKDGNVSEHPSNEHFEMKMPMTWLATGLVL